MKIEGSALIQMEVEGIAAETKSGSDTQTSNSLVVQGITFSPPGSSRSSKVFQFFWVSENAEKVICLKCRKVLKGISTSKISSKQFECQQYRQLTTMNLMKEMTSWLAVLFLLSSDHSAQSIQTLTLTFGLALAVFATFLLPVWSCCVTARTNSAHCLC